MFRWSIDDSSDNDESREEEEEYQEQDQQLTAKNIYFFSDSDNDDKCENNLNSEKNIRKIKNLLNDILINATNNHIKKSHDEFVKLQKICNQRPKIIKKDRIPHFFIYKLFKITQVVSDIAIMNRSAKKFEKDLKKFNQKYDKELAICQKNPDSFVDDDYFITESQTNNQNQSNDNDNYNHVLTNSMLNNNNSKKKYNNVNSDKNIEKELTKYSLSRSKGKIITNINHLFELNQMVISKELAQKIQLEICYTIEDNSFNQIISYDVWNLILEFLPNLINDVKRFVPLLEKLNKDLWKHSVQSCQDISFDVNSFYNILFRYVNIIKEFAQILQNEKEFTLFVRLETIFLEHIYFKDDVNIMNQAIYLFNLLEQNIFTELVTASFKAKISMFLAYNLAKRNLPQQASDVLNSKSIINSSSYKLIDHISLDQTIAQIGITAFNEGQYKLSNECFEKLIKSKNFETKREKKILIYQHSKFIDKNTIIVMNIFSNIFHNLPYLIVGINDQFKVIDKYNLWKILEEKKRTSQEEYLIFSTMINYAKENDWENAYLFAINHLGHSISQNEKFLNNIKKIFLSCFLLSISCTSIKIDYLIQKFELSKESILKIINEMINGISPLEKMQIEFKGQLSEDKKLLIIHDQKSEDSFEGFQSLIDIKSRSLKEQMEANNISIKTDKK